ncbi:MAG: cyclic pyranopterin monophosphate synthase MoaC [Candidatus Bathyarchaeia archaeon]
MVSDLSEFDPFRMVDIGGKEATPRMAEAYGKIFLKGATLNAIKQGTIEKGDPLSVAEVACIQAVKRTPYLLPMCHNIPIESVYAEFNISEECIEVCCRVTTESKTGVEMEALTGVSVALLNLWDMVKYLEKDEMGQYPDIRIDDIRVLRKEKK